MSKLIKYLVIKKYQLKGKLPRGVWAALYKVSLKKSVDQKIYSERKKLRKNTEQVFYVIRRRPPGAGLFSNVFHVLQGIINANRVDIDVELGRKEHWLDPSDENLENKAAIPIVDFQNYYMSQLHLKSEFPLNTNSWEIYFEQISKYNLENVYKKYSYILCDAGFKNSDSFLLQKAPLWVHDKPKLSEVHQMINSYIRPSRKLEDLISDWKSRINWNPHTTLTVGIRGGNYEKYQYSGHAKQATIYQIVPEIELFMEKYPISMIYPQTHDYNNYEILQKRFGEIVQKPFSMERFKDNSEFLSIGPKDRPQHWDRVPELTFEDNARYMVDIYLMSEAHYLIAPLSNGVAFALAKNKNLIDYKIMNFGVYA
jgi:hypothetical protein